MKWYKKAQLKHNKVKRIDDFRYHKDVQMRFYNEELLDKMIDDLREAIQYILINSDMYENPESIYSCPRCGAEEISWYHGTEDGGRGDPRNVSDLEMGHWQCGSCGEKIGFEEYFEKEKDSRGNWIYTEQGRSLSNALYQIDQAKDIEHKHMLFEQAIQFIHGSGRMSEWLIEGGAETINSMRQEHNL